MARHAISEANAADTAGQALVGSLINGPSNAAGRQSSAVNPDAAIADASPPTGTVVINGGAAATNTRSVTLTLSATDDLSGVTQMRFSNNGSSFSAAEAYATTKAWTLSTGNGSKTVYAQFKDGAGIWSTAAITDSIVFDNKAPTISALSVTAITSSSATITWTTNEPTTSQVDYGLTTSYGSTTTLDPSLVTVHSVVVSGLVANTTYYFRARSLDAAGNLKLSSNKTFKTAAGADTIAPTVGSINRVTASPTNLASVQWRVIFSESVTGVDAADFAVAASGVAGAAITGVTGSGTTFTVTAGTGTGSGTLGLNLVDNDTIVDASANRLGGSGTGNGNFTGQVYTVDKLAPSVTINQAAGQTDPTDASPINFTVVFSETVTSFTSGDVTLSGTAGATTATVTGSGTTYNVAVSGMSASGTVRAAVAAGVASDAAGNLNQAATSTDNTVTFNFTSSGSFSHEILATGFDLPTTMAFLPDGKMLVAELGGKIRLVLPPYTQIESTPFLQLSNIGTNSAEQGLYEIAIDPNYASNHYLYISYTLGTPNHDRLSRFTVNAAQTGIVAGSELVLYEDTQVSGNDHHGGVILFGNDGKIYFTTGDDLEPAAAQSLSSPRGKILRINPDGSIPADNPFYDGTGPHYDAIWALGLRNPYRGFYDAQTDRIFLGDVGGNDWNTAIEELNVGVRGANYGWPNVEAPNGNPAYTAPIYYYTHIVDGSTRDAAITAGFVYRGTQFPASYQGSFFFADYVQNWIKRMTFDANGNVTGVFNFEPPDGTLDGPYGDIVKLVQGPEGALYYVDIGFSDLTNTYGLSKIHRIQYIQSNQPPVVAAAATPTNGVQPLTVSFSSAGSSDPEGLPLTYLWTFGDGANSTSTQANPTHTYLNAGQYQARLTVSDGVNSTLSAPISISVGNKPSIVNFSTTPSDGGLFRAGDVITYGAAATDIEDGTLPASAFTWNIDFLHEGHVHPGTPVTGVTSGSFSIPTSGHDFSGFTRYRITLTVTDSHGLQATQSATVFPEKVNLTFDTAPGGLTLYIDGIAHTAPFVHDTLIAYSHTIEARNQSAGTNTYTFASWSDGGAQQHSITVPTTAQSYTASYTVVATPLPAGLAAGWSFNETSLTSAADSSGNGNTATLVNGVARTTGKYGGGLTFDGVNDYLSVPNSTSLDIAGSGLTLSMWINPQALSFGDSVVLGKFWNTTMTSPYYQYGLELAGGTEPTFEVGTTGGVRLAFMGSDLALNQWSHLAAVFDGSQVRFFVNGALVSTVSLPATISARGNPVRIGADASIQQFFKGSLDEVRIYNRALTAQEVQIDMGSTGSALTQFLVSQGLAGTQPAPTWAVSTADEVVPDGRTEFQKQLSLNEVGVPPPIDHDVTDVSHHRRSRSQILPQAVDELLLTDDFMSLIRQRQRQQRFEDVLLHGLSTAANKDTLAG